MQNGRTDTVNWNGSSYRTLLTTEETNGAMSIVDSTTPADEGPPRHVHANEDEVFIGVTGETRRLGPSQSGFIPRGKEHTFRVCSDTPSRHLVILTPGGFEGFFYEAADGALRFPEDMPAIIETAARHHLTFTGPPLGAEG